MNSQPLTKNPQAIETLKECMQLGYSDKKIQQILLEKFNYKWALVTIRTNKKRLKSTEVQIDDPQPPLSVPPPGLSENEKLLWFMNNFKKSHLFKVLQQQFSEAEVDIYLEEYARICCQFEDIVVSEFFQIDKYLKHRILINRQLILTKTLQKEIDELVLWLSENPISEDDSMDQKKKKIDAINRLDSKHNKLEQANERYGKLVKEEETMSKSLNATRKDRMDQLAGGKENFFNLVIAMQHSEEERNRQGKYAELTKIAAEDVGCELRKPVEFPDGTTDTVITDHESVK